MAVTFKISVYRSRNIGCDIGVTVVLLIISPSAMHSLPQQKICNHFPNCSANVTLLCRIHDLESLSIMQNFDVCFLLRTDLFLFTPCSSTIYCPYIHFDPHNSDSAIKYPDVLTVSAEAGNALISLHYTFHITLNHLGQVTYICVRKLAIIGSGYGLLPSRRQPIIWSNVRILSIGPCEIPSKKF